MVRWIWISYSDFCRGMDQFDIDIVCHNKRETSIMLINLSHNNNILKLILWASIQHFSIPNTYTNWTLNRKKKKIIIIMVCLPPWIDSHSFAGWWLRDVQNSKWFLRLHLNIIFIRVSSIIFYLRKCFSHNNFRHFPCVVPGYRITRVPGVGTWIRLIST